MGRFDLARPRYEAALAVAPTDPLLISTFAAALRRHGFAAEAATLLAEAAPSRSGVAPSPVPATGDEPPLTMAATEPNGDVPEKATAAPSITVQLPPARIGVPGGSATKAAAPAARTAAVQPRLVRLSGSEVALLTNDRPAWTTQLIKRTPQSVTVRFVPLKPTAVPPAIQLLNAARRQGLAARTRQALVQRGWRRIAIGDSPQTRARSLVLYPADRQQLGRRLAAQFGFGSALTNNGRSVVVLLGRDAVSVSLERAGG
jgi:hypothetical protein